MAQQLRTIKRRITSVKSTQKITRAMELIASSRIIKAQQRVEAARPYAEEMRRLMGSVGKRVGTIDHPLLKERDEIRRVGTIVITADRGLAGAYNSNIIRAAERDLQAHGREPELFLVGKKAVTYFRFRGYDFEHSWLGVTDQPKVEDARAVARAAAAAFAEGRVDEVRLAYTRFESALTQRPVVVKLLPLPKEELEDAQPEQSDQPQPSYEFEPEPEEILDVLLPRYIEGTVLQGMLEASASEHAARRRAMKAATDNAEELMGTLSRVYNQARQAEITTEIMEVVGGAEALTAAAKEGN
ncbi:MAG TPA: F0F1 ATP synthase subunit gamma [Actinomycetota bacterium]|jgi:F-type H+-transporting ATPase subunit gamma|nr:F0F1 ATP synthase subunit gamma [Actinomycetota bacterium]